MAVLPDLERDWIENAEPRRRALLRLSDEILDAVEDLRLANRRSVPTPLGEAIATLQRRLGRSDPPVAPATVRAAHDLVLAVQGRLLSANPRLMSPRSHHGRGAGQPLIHVVEGRVSWKMLVLPPRPPGRDAQWAELVNATVERAYHRWLYASEQLRRAAAARDETFLAWHRGQAAWSNYWELKEEAERLMCRRQIARRTPA